MARGERPLDAADTPLGRLAAELRELRRAAGGPTYRELAERAGYSMAALSKAASGRALPSLTITLAYVRACGGDVGQWRGRWRAVAAELATTAEPADSADEGDSPYLGLAAFQAGDADRFFGREAVVDDLRELVSTRRFTGVFGASGAGKSSVLRAGLVAAATGPTAVITPGPRPLDELAVAVASLGHAEEALLVVDQFEELFTLGADEADRERFTRTLVRVPDDGPRVVIGVRADCFGRCGRYPELVDALRGGQYLVGAMSTEDLRQAITRPAMAAGCMVEAALVSRLIADAAGQGMVLPLVSHALRETWRRRSGATLTLAGYEAVGGIEHAVARSAEQLWATFTGDEPEIARRLLLRLVAVGETEHTKRRVSRHELDLDPAALEVLERLTRARLLTVDQDTVDITHEALIQCWPRLREWVDADRDGLRVHHLLTDATDAWEAHLRDPGTLYRGARLAAAQDWAAANDSAFTQREREFLVASVEAEAAERAVAERHTRRLRRLVALLAVLLLAAAVAVVQAVRAERVAEAERNTAIARRVLADAASIRASNPGLAAQLVLAAHRLIPLAETRDTVLSAHGGTRSSRLTGHTNQEIFLAYAPDGRLMATASGDRTLRLWDVTDSAHPALIATVPVGERLMAVAFAGGATVVTIGERGTRLWDVTNSRDPVELASPEDSSSSLASIAYSAQNGILATATNNKDVRLWNVTDPRRPRPVASIQGRADRLHQVAVSPDGRTLAAAGGGNVELWDLREPERPRPAGTLSGHAALVSGVAFSPDGGAVATASWDREVRLWDVRNPDAPRTGATLVGHTAAVSSVAFSADGGWLASTGGGTILWDLTDPARPANVATLPGGRSSAAFSPDSATVAAVDEDAGVRLQELRALPLVGHRDVVASVAFSPDGRVLATASWDGSIRLWDVSDARQRRPLARLPGGVRPARSAVFSPDGRTLATASEDGVAVLWDVADPVRPVRHATIEPGTAEVFALAYRPDGGVLALAGAHGLSLWDVAERAAPRRLSQPGGLADEVWSVLFSPDGRTVLTGGAGERQTRRWDVTDPAAPREADFPPGADELVTARSLSPDGRYLSTWNDREKTQRLLDVTDFDHPRPLAALPGHGGMVWMSAFSPDGRLLATAGADATVRLWDLTRPDRPLAAGTLSGHTDDVGAVVFRPDGQVLASGATDHSAHLWETTPDRAAAGICATAPPPISREEWARFLPEHDYRPPCAR
ncbi:hypothetical protein ACPZ19_16895 [Amycolatopsis lurida]